MVTVTIEDMKVDPEHIHLREVKPTGNGAYIIFLKKFIGKKVYVITEWKNK